MMDRYGKAVVEERTQPRDLAEVRRYLRMEYGLGTETDALLRDASEEESRLLQMVQRGVRRVVNALANALGAQEKSHARQPGSGPADPARRS